MQNKWRSAFKSFDGTARKTDYLLKTFKSSGSILGQVNSQASSPEPTEKELRVANNNLSINDMLNNIRLNNSLFNSKTPENYMF